MAVDVNTFISPLQQLAFSFMEPLPSLVGALVVLVFGYVIACLLGWLVRKVLALVQFEHWVYEKAHIKKLMKGFKLNNFLALVTKWYVFVWFFAPAAELVRLPALAEVLLKFSIWIPNLIAALVIGFLGFIAAEYVHDKVKSMKGKGHQFMADAVKIVILVFTGLIVLEQIGLQVGLAQQSFLIILGAFALAFALAVGIACGLGMQKDARSYMKQLKKKF